MTKECGPAIQYASIVLGLAAITSAIPIVSDIGKIRSAVIRPTVESEKSFAIREGNELVRLCEANEDKSNVDTNEREISLACNVVTKADQFINGGLEARPWAQIETRLLELIGAADQKGRCTRAPAEIYEASSPRYYQIYISMCRLRELTRNYFVWKNKMQKEDDFSDQVYKQELNASIFSTSYLVAWRLGAALLLPYAAALGLFKILADFLELMEKE
jgi:hypothetical protein